MNISISRISKGDQVCNSSVATAADGSLISVRMSIIHR